MMHPECVRQRQADFQDGLVKAIRAPAFERIAPQPDQRFDESQPARLWAWHGRAKNRFAATQHGKTALSFK